MEPSGVEGNVEDVGYVREGHHDEMNVEPSENVREGPHGEMDQSDEPVTVIGDEPVTVIGVEPTAIIESQDIRKEKIKLKNKITSYHAIISSIDIWQAQNCSNSEGPLVFARCQALDKLKDNINIYLEETYNQWCEVNKTSNIRGGNIKSINNYSNKKMRGGQKDLQSLKGKIVIYIYDPAENKYILADYYDMFKTYFQEMIGTDQSTIDSSMKTQGGKTNIKTRKTRKNRNKLTRKKYKKVKARKTRYQYKKHRYTRHKK